MNNPIFKLDKNGLSSNFHKRVAGSGRIGEVRNLAYRFQGEIPLGWKRIAHRKKKLSPIQRTHLLDNFRQFGNNRINFGFGCVSAK